MEREVFSMVVPVKGRHCTSIYCVMQGFIRGRYGGFSCEACISWEYVSH